jgi:hypothetical protein
MRRARSGSQLSCYSYNCVCVCVLQYFCVQFCDLNLCMSVCVGKITTKFTLNNIVYMARDRVAL